MLASLRDRPATLRPLGRLPGSTAAMNGIDWRTVGRENFEKITEILLSREYGNRGVSVNGRGGDAGIDYRADGTRIIFQFKFFPEGFPTGNPSRRTQIRKSFAKAQQHDPAEWVLVVPAKLTLHERSFVERLGKSSKTKISIRDETWLDDELMKEENRSLLDHYLYASDIEYLHHRAELLARNPVVRNSADLDHRIRELQHDIDVADPNYTLEFSTIGGQRVQVLTPRDSGALERSPVTLTFNVFAYTESPETKLLTEASVYGQAKTISLSGSMISNFRVEGTKLLDGIGDTLDEVVLGPDQPSAATPGEVTLSAADGTRTGVYLVDSRLLSRGARGAVVEVVVADLLKVTMRVPFDPTADLQSGADFQFSSVSDQPIRAVFEATDFVMKLAAAETWELKIRGSMLAKMASPKQLLQEFIADIEPAWLLADDLLAIESATGARFRQPSEIGAIERIHIRNLRLMIEGHCVAHPTANLVTSKLSGRRDAGFDRFLTPEPRWVVATFESATAEILDQPIEIPTLTYAALVSLTEEDLADIERNLANGTAEGLEMRLRTAPHDRVRMYLSDRIGPTQSVDVTPWNLDGINQQGLDADGKPFTA